MFGSRHPLTLLIDELKKFPGIGGKSAQRIAFHLLDQPREDIDRLTDSIQNAKQKVFTCSICFSLTHVDPCEYCTDDTRDDEVLCVLEEPFNIASIEKTGVYHGRYHVLMGALSPLKGKGPDELKIDQLKKRVEEGHFREIILATNPTADGETTAHYLFKLLNDGHIRLTRLAMGLPVGSDLDFADQVTIKRSLEGRTTLKE
ncbi:MAG: recombination mediator RecR [Acidobacteria bacterium]|nr:recombination mediator RecR [Acidobacteriota bacterium]MCG2817309.1 recombination mediator RecR [Candidatus Aminicenantes bacterium]MBU4203183.1 recombination mediator RecR [Acidobacteriota bacterium]MBU4253491.1 recombination mediator RecR [Acidobacteriota bacterium]MBU4329529.1 recombination mediator RecR [Acidobacteriota bacterium]